MCSGNIEDHLKLSEWYPPTITELLSSGLGTPGNYMKKSGKGGGSFFKKIIFNHSSFALIGTSI